jgi:hypothetical protein
MCGLQATDRGSHFLYLKSKLCTEKSAPDLTGDWIQDP